jgi:hypothetical protein
MKKIATTYRIDAVLKEGLSKLSKLRRQPRNRLVNEAIREYVAKYTMEAEHELESSLEDLRAYRKSDPRFERAIEAFAEAELTVKEDPAEGTVIETVSPRESAVLKHLND